MALLILGHPDYLNSIANKTIVEQLNTDISDLEIRNIQELYSDFRIDVKAEQPCTSQASDCYLPVPILLVWHACHIKTLV